MTDKQKSAEYGTGLKNVNGGSSYACRAEPTEHCYLSKLDHAFGHAHNTFSSVYE
jgi:hypothetical protein